MQEAVKGIKDKLELFIEIILVLVYFLCYNFLVIYITSFFFNSKLSSSLRYK